MLAFSVLGRVSRPDGAQMASGTQANSKGRETTAFLLLTVCLFPALTVAFIAIFGFVVWVSQMIGGPPGS